MKSWKKLFSILAIVSVVFLIPLSIQIDTTRSIVVGVQQAEALSMPCNGIIDMVCNIQNALLSFYEIVFYFTTQIFVVIMGLMMDAILSFSISSNFYRQSGIIELGWEVLRDLTNILFIFALVSTAFKLVLGIKTQEAKKHIIKIILVALTINFSLFMTYAIIDSSNILAHVFYNRIDSDASNYDQRVREKSIQTDRTGVNNGISLATWVKKTQVKKSVSLAIAGQINPQRIITTANIDNFFVAFILVTGMAIMNILLIYIFFKVFLVFLGRILGLLLSAILSPLAMASLVIPKLRKQKYIGWDQWFSDLLKLSFSAPIFLFFLWLTVTFISNEGVLSTISSNTNTSWIITIINTYLLLFLVGGILYLAKDITEKMSGELGSFATKAVKGAIGGTIAVAGMVATGGASAVGGLARRAPKGSRMNTLGKSLQATNFNFGASRLGKMANKHTGINFGENIGKMSYSRASTAVTTNLNKARERWDNIKTKKTPKNVQEWQDNIQESRDNLKNSKIKNAERVAEETAKTKEKTIYTGYSDGTFGHMTEGQNLKEVLKTYQETLDRMSEENKNNESSRIKISVDPLKVNLKYYENSLKTATKQDNIKTLQTNINKTKNQIEKIEGTSTSGIIKQIKKQLDEVKKDARNAVT